MDDARTSLLMARTGDRVRRARKRQGLSRQALSEASGVSLRYLAQLEGGEGNISIARLDAIARALGAPVDWFLAEADLWDEAAARLPALMAAADPDRRAQVLALLGVTGRGRRVALVGLRGAGKSSLGTAAAALLNVPFVQLNDEIAKLAGMPVAEIMALYGPEGYRQYEGQALDHVARDREAVILEVAGGIVGQPETFARLTQAFHTIWLKAAPEDHMARVRAQGDTRPMEGQAQAMDRLRAILTEREAIYARATAQLNTSGRNEAEALSALVTLIENQGFLQEAP